MSWRQRTGVPGGIGIVVVVVVLVTGGWITVLALTGGGGIHRRAASRPTSAPTTDTDEAPSSADAPPTRLSHIGYAALHLATDTVTLGIHRCDVDGVAHPGKFAVCMNRQYRAFEAMDATARRGVAKLEPIVSGYCPVQMRALVRRYAQLGAATSAVHHAGSNPPKRLIRVYHTALELTESSVQATYAGCVPT